MSRKIRKTLRQSRKRGVKSRGCSKSRLQRKIYKSKNTSIKNEETSQINNLIYVISNQKQEK